MKKLIQIFKNYSNFFLKLLQILFKSFFLKNLFIFIFCTVIFISCDKKIIINNISEKTISTTSNSEVDKIFSQGIDVTGNNKNSVSQKKLKKSNMPCSSLFTKEDISAWIDTHFNQYFQKYNLSCEAAIIRLVCGFWCIPDLSEDDILAMMNRHQFDPNKGLVMENIRGEAYMKDGSANWVNYGAHSPVVKDVLEKILIQFKKDNLFTIENHRIDDEALINLIKINKNCLGAIIWVAAYIDGKKPPQNEYGQVLGEHVQFVSPILDSLNRMVVYDVWPWKDQPFHFLKPFNRALFDFDTLLIMKKNS